jgi:hypothetical protein
MTSPVRWSRNFQPKINGFTAAISRTLERSKPSTPDPKEPIPASVQGKKFAAQFAPARQKEEFKLTKPKSHGSVSPSIQFDGNFTSAESTQDIITFEELKRWAIIQKLRAEIERLNQPDQPEHVLRHIRTLKDRHKDRHPELFKEQARDE